nr:GNAT family N-acetyltransferase [uncultured Desulfobacter sp.]
MHLRTAHIEDARLLYDWANDLEARRMAFSCAAIDWAAHIKWLEKKLNDANTYIYIAMEDNDPIGQIRFDVINHAEAQVDIHTKPNMRGKGVGSRIIDLGVHRFFSDSRVNTIHAVIKQENTKSRCAFKNAGFKDIQRKSINGVECILMIKNRMSN